MDNLERVKLVVEMIELVYEAQDKMDALIDSTEGNDPSYTLLDQGFFNLDCIIGQLKTLEHIEGMKLLGKNPRPDYGPG